MLAQQLSRVASRAGALRSTPGRLALPAASRGFRQSAALRADDALATKTKAGDVSTETAPAVDPHTMEAFTGAPAEMLKTRVVKIYQQAQTVQNATQNMVPWRIQWEDSQTKRWTNPLMGWTSTSDPLSNAHMTLEFHTPEDAARFCESNGWKYEIEESKPNKEIHASPKKYADAVETFSRPQVVTTVWFDL